MSKDPSHIDPSIWFQDHSINQPSAHRTNNSHIKLIFNHEDHTCKRVLHFLRDMGIEPDLIHFRYSPLTRRELTGLLKAIPYKDLEFFVKLNSYRYQSQPFTISQQYCDQTVNHILPYQYELLGVPIVYNVLTNSATVVPPITPNYDHNNIKKKGDTSSKNDIVDFEKVLPVVIKDAIGDNQLWDHGADLFPIPHHLQKTRNSQKNWEKQKYEHFKAEQDHKTSQKDISTKFNSSDTHDRVQAIDTIVNQQANQFKQLYEETRQHQQREQKRQEIEYDPITGKPTPQSLGLTTNQHLKSKFDYPGNQTRIPMVSVGNEITQHVNNVMHSRSSWRRKQEKEFGKLDDNEFEQWRREKAQRERINERMNG